MPFCKKLHLQNFKTSTIFQDKNDHPIQAATNVFVLFEVIFPCFSFFFDIQLYLSKQSCICCWVRKVARAVKYVIHIFFFFNLKGSPFYENSASRHWKFGKCPKTLYTKVSDKMTCNSADPDQAAPEGGVWSGSILFTTPLCILRNNCIKSKKKSME